MNVAVRAMRRLRDETRGLALVEFAMVLPFMLILYLGGFQISDGIACNRKVTIAARALADLVAQNVSGATSASEVDGDLHAMAQVLQPYSTANATGRITEVYTDSNYNTTVIWSRGVNTTGYKAGSPIVIPWVFKGRNMYVLLSEVSYPYRPPVLFSIVQPLTFSDSIYMMPRNTNNIACPDC